MASTSTLDSISDQLGFSYRHYVEGRASISDLFNPRVRCGIYLLEFSTGEVYAGQAVDVTRRYVQHRRTHRDITHIRFRPTKRIELNDIERQVIWELERQGLLLRNFTFTSAPQGESDFDLIMSKPEQDIWQSDHTPAVNFEIDRPAAQDLRRKYQRRFAKFMSIPQAQDVLNLLGSFLRCSIPSLGKTELSFWSCSCIPGGYGVNNRVLARINVNWQEVFNVYQDENQLITSWYLAPSILMMMNETEQNNFDQRYPDLQDDEFFYEPGGQDQLHVFSSNIQNCIQLMHERIFVEALRIFVLRLMRKGPCIYSRYHCPQLVDEALRAAMMSH